jgi:hypothetical protein
MTAGRAAERRWSIDPVPGLAFRLSGSLGSKAREVLADPIQRVGPRGSVLLGAGVAQCTPWRRRRAGGRGRLRWHTPGEGVMEKPALDIARERVLNWTIHWSTFHVDQTEPSFGVMTAFRLWQPCH